MDESTRDAYQGALTALGALQERVSDGQMAVALERADAAVERVRGPDARVVGQLIAQIRLCHIRGEVFSRGLARASRAASARLRPRRYAGVNRIE